MFFSVLANVYGKSCEYRYPMIHFGFCCHNSRHFHHSSLAETGSWQLGDYGLFVTVWILRHKQEGDLLKTLTGILQNG